MANHLRYHSIYPSIPISVSLPVAIIIIIAVVIAIRGNLSSKKYLETCTPTWRFERFGWISFFLAESRLYQKHNQSTNQP